MRNNRPSPPISERSDEHDNFENVLRLTRSISLPTSALKFRFARSSGPGGQNVNKVATKVELLFNPSSLRGVDDAHRTRLAAGLASRLDSKGVLHVVSDGSRSQWANREDAVAKLVDLLRVVLRERKVRRLTAPTTGSRQRRALSKERRGKIKRLRKRVSPED